MCLSEPARTYSSAQFGCAAMGHGASFDRADRSVLTFWIGAARREQPQEMRLPTAVRAENRDPLPEPDLRVEAAHQPGELQILTDDGALSGTATPQAHGHPLLSRGGLGRPCFLEPPQTRLGRLVSTREPVVVGRLGLVHQDQRFELRVFLVPAPPELVEAFEPRGSGVVIGGEPAG